MSPATPPQNMPPSGLRATEPDLGPSDSSDSANDLPPGWAGNDSDAAGTGERAAVDSPPNARDSPDILPDAIVGADEAGLEDIPEDPPDDETPP